eukprot:6628101-Lingulodinium_polyedra.AAC.1
MRRSLQLTKAGFRTGASGFFCRKAAAYQIVSGIVWRRRYARKVQPERRRLPEGQARRVRRWAAA